MYILQEKITPKGTKIVLETDMSSTLFGYTEDVILCNVLLLRIYTDFTAGAGNAPPICEHLYITLQNFKEILFILAIACILVCPRPTVHRYRKVCTNLK